MSTTNIGSRNPPGSPRRWPIVKRAKPSCSPTTRAVARVRTDPRDSDGASAPSRWRDDLRVVAVGDEADVLALRLLGDELEAELVRDGARLGLRLRADGQEHARQHRAVDSPEEVRLVLVVIEPAVQLAVDDARVVAGRDPVRVDRVGLRERDRGTS